MFKKVNPEMHVGSYISQFPHCDQRILHAPGECDYCDKHPEWQALRLAWGVAFTGYEPEGKELPCPATFARGGKENIWTGNQSTIYPSVGDPPGWPNNPTVICKSSTLDSSTVKSPATTARTSMTVQAEAESDATGFVDASPLNSGYNRDKVKALQREIEETGDNTFVGYGGY